MLSIMGNAFAQRYVKHQSLSETTLVILPVVDFIKRLGSSFVHCVVTLYTWSAMVIHIPAVEDDAKHLKKFTNDCMFACSSRSHIDQLVTGGNKPHYTRVLQAKWKLWAHASSEPFAVNMQLHQTFTVVRNHVKDLQHTVTPQLCYAFLFLGEHAK